MIANFMDIQTTEWRPRKYKFLVVLDKDGNFDWDEITHYTPDTDWNQLRLVLDKCWADTTEDQRQFEGLELFELGLFTDIETVWKAVIDFITWFNKQPKKEPS